MCISKVAATGAIAYNSIIHNGIITSNSQTTRTCYIYSTCDVKTNDKR